MKGAVQPSTRQNPYGASAHAAFCAICGAAAQRKLFGAGTRQITECSGCGLARLVPPFTDAERECLYTDPSYHDSLAITSAQGTSAGDLGYTATSKRRLARRLLALCGSGAEAIEIGCGTGDFLRHCKDVGLRPTGLEISPHAAELCRREHGIDITVGEFSTGVLPEGRFDAVALLHFIEHAANPADVLSEAYRILKPGGVILLTTPNLWGIGTRVFGAGNYALDPYQTGHMWWFGYRSLRYALAAACFGEIELWSELFLVGNVVSALQRRRAHQAGLAEAVGYQRVRRGFTGGAVRQCVMRTGDRVLSAARLGDALGALARKPLAHT